MLTIASSCLLREGSPPPRIYDSESGARVDLDSTEEGKDVGVWVTSDMKPSLQFQKASTNMLEALGESPEGHHRRYILREVTLDSAPSGESLYGAPSGESIYCEASGESLSTAHPPGSHSLWYILPGVTLDGTSSDELLTTNGAVALPEYVLPEQDDILNATSFRCGCKLNGGEPCYSVFTRGNDMMEMIPPPSRQGRQDY
ncbi:hypothetical protein LSAT2_030769 [Lamellibrachia satsuma]|nr:hypothetical protein LSAT2_030769 [Lamellibrachia satsuma]